MPIQNPSFLPAGAVGRRCLARGLSLAGALLAVAAVCGPAPVRAQQRPPEAGQVISADGETMLLRDGSLSTPVKVGESVRSGDVLRTMVQARVQLRMVDGGLVAVEPHSEFQVSSYRFDEQQQHSFLKLVRGVVRVVTGAIGKRDPADFRMTTPTATIGIRGTEFIARESDCRGADCPAGERPGLTLSVLQGRVVVNSPAVGELDVPAGQTVYVAALGPGAPPSVPSAPVAPQAPTAPSPPSWSPSSSSQGSLAAPAREEPASRSRRATKRGDQPELIGPPPEGSPPEGSPSGSQAAPAASVAAVRTQTADEARTGTASPRRAGRGKTPAPMPDSGMLPRDLFDDPDSFAGRTHHPPAGQN